MSTPSISSPKLSPAPTTFSQATPSQILQVCTMNYPSWGSPLTLPAHITREKHLSEQPLTKNGKWKTWILTLVDSDSPDGEIVASCETFEKRILVGVEDGDGVIGEEKGYGIASVFTRKEYRGRGYAGVLLRGLKEWFDGLDGERGVCSVLYSDIGKSFYTKLGWDPFPSKQIILELNPDDIVTSDAQAECRVIEGVRLLKQADLEALCERDIDAMKQRFKNETLQPRNQTRIAFLPTYEQACWHWSKEQFHVASRGEISEIKGAISASGNVWMYWYHDVDGGKLKIQRIVILDREDEERRIDELALLLQQAVKEASGWGIKKVIVWNPCEEVRVAARRIGETEGIGIEEEERQVASIPSLRWKRGRKNEKIVWDSDEFYAWC
ncbi:hypothetical protein EJ08DRAFT_702884 [Tothia fuscella]|uniref:N-acetyltransferase domain-containing protein n=1 Tax=Tothia fuscella TaxID=1048955 RepID=A0A9P4NFX0_9PEZI|nr:hypothetical protein EJ08DRAFT_702884 [Tothia fuscella]